MILRFDYSPTTEAQIIAMLPVQVRKAVQAHLIMERQETELKLRRHDWREGMGSR